MPKRLLLRLLAVSCLLTPVVTTVAGPERLADLRGVFRASFNHDGSHVIVYPRKGDVGIWEISTGTRIREDLGPNPASDTYLMSADAKMVLVGFKDGHSRVFEATTAKAISPMLDVPVGGPPAVFSPDGETLLIFAKKEAAVFNIRGGKRITTLPLPPGVVFENSAFFLRGHHDNYIVKLSFPELKITDSLRILDSVLSTSLSPDGKRIQIQQGRTGQERLLFFDAATLKPLE